MSFPGATDTRALPCGHPAAFAAAPRRRWLLKRSMSPAQPRGRAAASGTQPVPARRVANAACAAVLALEAIGSLSMWVPLPLAWLWVGGRVYAGTSSLAADCGVAFVGFVATTSLAMAALGRLDRVWVVLRRRAGHDQGEGALTQVVVVSATLGILLFLLWFYVLSKNAFVIPFMGQ